MKCVIYVDVVVVVVVVVVDVDVDDPLTAPGGGC